MIFRSLAGTRVSAVAYGSWQIGGAPFWKNKGDDSALESIEAALEAGINLFDTAPVYGFGHSETLLGRALRKHRDKVVIATKCGLLWNADGKMYRCLKPESIRREAEASLKRLSADFIDLYQIHWPSPDDPVEPAMEALAGLKEAGKIRMIGVSNFDLPLLKRAMGVVRVDSLQPKYNLIERDAEKELLPFCAENKIGVLAYSPLASGLLTGKYDRTHKFDDWRSGAMGVFKKELIGGAFDKVEELKRKAAQLGVPLAHMALRWVLANKSVTAAIVGVKEAAQLREIVKCVARPMTDEELALI
ncbi:MAG: aldo/keto reductase [Nitrospinae bacterium]|nr:aldo/keto reductase [Nitrospinota bacterium]